MLHESTKSCHVIHDSVTLGWKETRHTQIASPRCALIYLSIHGQRMIDLLSSYATDIASKDFSSLSDSCWSFSRYDLKKKQHTSKHVKH